MNGPQDLGGQMGFGPVAPEDDEPVFHRRKFLHEGAPPQPAIIWVDPSTGKEMTQDAWRREFVRCIGCLLHGGPLDTDEFGEPVFGSTILVLFNADHAVQVPFKLPAIGKEDRAWELIFDTFEPAAMLLVTIGPYRSAAFGVLRYLSPRI